MGISSDQFNCSAFFLRTRLYTTDMMILLLKCEAPDQMPHRRFKNNHSFLCKSFLKCLVSDLLYTTTICTFGDNTAACEKTKRSHQCRRKEVSQCCQVQLPQIGLECRCQSPRSLTTRQCQHHRIVLVNLLNN